MFKIYVTTMAVLAGIIVLAVLANIWLFFRIWRTSGADAAMQAFFRARSTNGRRHAGSTADAAAIGAGFGVHGYQGPALPAVNPATGAMMMTDHEGNPGVVDTMGNAYGQGDSGY